MVGSPLLRELMRLIDQTGALPLDRYMEIALSDPTHGYYTTRDPLGLAGGGLSGGGLSGGGLTGGADEKGEKKGGDFITAPEISQVFGELLGLWAVNCWQAMGAPNTLHLVELGPGRGTLMRDALRAALTVPDFIKAVQIDLVEISPVLQKRQKQTLQTLEKLSGFAKPIKWHKNITTLPDAPCIIFANEFFDALPIKQFIRNADNDAQNNEWKEKKIAHENGKLIYQFDATDNPPDVSLYPKINAEQIVEQCPAASAIMHTLGTHLAANDGVLLAIDYGYSAPAVGDSFQALEKHQSVDPLTRPGCADLTAHVNFAQLAKDACEAGLNASPIITQRDLLLALGADYRFKTLMDNASKTQQIELAAARNRLLEPDQMGVLFKALALFSKNLKQPAGFEQNHD